MKKSTKMGVVSAVFWVPAVFLLMSGCADYSSFYEDEEPPEGVTLYADSATDSSITVHWTKNNDEDFLSYMIFYSHTNNVVDTTSDVYDTLHFRVDTALTLMDLNSGAEYWVRVIVSDQDHNLTPSNTVSYRTLKEPEIDLVQPDSTEITETQITLRWSFNNDEEDNKYRVFYDDMPTVDSTDEYFPEDIEDTVYTAERLEPGKSYWFRVYMIEEERLLYGSNTVSVTTDTVETD